MAAWISICPSYQFPIRYKLGRRGVPFIMTEVLVVRESSITDAGLEYLPKLKKLDLKDSNMVTPEGVSNLQSDHPSLVITRD